MLGRALNRGHGEASQHAYALTPKTRKTLRCFISNDIHHIS